MKHYFIAGNWKSYKQCSEAKAWFEKFTELVKLKSNSWENVTAVLCPPFTLLPYAHKQVTSSTLPIQLGGQDISSFGEGAFTGEINAAQLAEFAQWSIIGHSERRKNLGETDDLLRNKVKAATEAKINVIYCVQDDAVAVPDGVSVIAYEPPWAISAVSGGVSQDPERANEVCEKIAQKHAGIPVIYGGSTTPDNVLSFVSQPSISGVLPGGASLNPEKFFRMIDLLASNAS